MGKTARALVGALLLGLDSVVQRVRDDERNLDYYIKGWAKIQERELLFLTASKK